MATDWEGRHAVPRHRPDPELIRQLDAAGPGQEVSAVFSVRPDPGAEAAPSPEETAALVDDLVQRVQQQTGQEPGRVTVFRNLGSFAVSAPADFVRRLLEQREVVTATANVRPEDLPIRPVGPRRRPGRAE
jgi:hypothetical protein